MDIASAIDMAGMDLAMFGLPMSSTGGSGSVQPHQSAAESSGAYHNNNGGARQPIVRAPPMTREMATRIVELVLNRERELLNGHAGRMVDENGVRNFAWGQIRDMMMIEFPHYEFTLKNIKRKWDNECATAKAKIAQMRRSAEMGAPVVMPQLNDSERMLVNRFRLPRMRHSFDARGINSDQQNEGSYPSIPGIRLHDGGDGGSSNQGTPTPPEHEHHFLDDDIKPGISVEPDSGDDVSDGDGGDGLEAEVDSSNGALFNGVSRHTDDDLGSHHDVDNDGGRESREEEEPSLAAASASAVIYSAGRRTLKPSDPPTMVHSRRISDRRFDNCEPLPKRHRDEPHPQPQPPLQALHAATNHNPAGHPTTSTTSASSAGNSNHIGNMGNGESAEKVMKEMHMRLLQTQLAQATSTVRLIDEQRMAVREQRDLFRACRALVDAVRDNNIPELITVWLRNRVGIPDALNDPNTIATFEKLFQR